MGLQLDAQQPSGVTLGLETGEYGVGQLVVHTMGMQK